MSRYIPDTIRQLVAQRARYCCEYCHLPQAASYYSFEIDHIISLKHEGMTDLENLALACGACNLLFPQSLRCHHKGRPMEAQTMKSTTAGNYLQPISSESGL